MGLAEKLQRSVCASRARLDSGGADAGAFAGPANDLHRLPNNGVERSHSTPQFCYGGSASGSRKRKPSCTRPSSASTFEQQRRSASRPSSAKENRRPTSASSSNGNGRSASGQKVETPILAYLRLFGLTQYARAFVDAGMADLSTIARQSESQALDFLESVQVYPGQRVKLLRAMESLRQATVLGSTRTESKEEATMERLCERNEMLSLERSEVQAQNRILQEENHHLFIKVREQAAENKALEEELQVSRSSVTELEQTVWAQTEQVSFLALQLQRVIERDQSKARRVAPATSDHPATSSATAASAPSDAAASRSRGNVQVASSGPLGSDRIAECLQGGMVCDRSVQCLAAAIHGRLNASSTTRRDGSSPSREDHVFVEPNRLNSFFEPVLGEAVSPTLQHSVSGSERDPMSPCSVFASCQPVLSKWEVCEHIAEAMQVFQMQPEVSVIALVYLDRFSERSGTAITMDNWRRLIFIALVLAMKVWDEAPFDNEEIAQISPQYSLNELCTLERAFLRGLEFDLSVHDAEYADVQQMLRDFGGQAEPSPETLDSKTATAFLERCRKEEATLRKRYAESSKKALTGTTLP